MPPNDIVKRCKEETAGSATARAEAALGNDGAANGDDDDPAEAADSKTAKEAAAALKIRQGFLRASAERRAKMADAVGAPPKSPQPQQS